MIHEVHPTIRDIYGELESLKTLLLRWRMEGRQAVAIREQLEMLKQHVESLREMLIEG